MKKYSNIVTVLFLNLSVVFCNWEIMQGPGYNNYKFAGLDVYNNKIYIALGGSIFCSENLGKSWYLINKKTDTIFSDIVDLTVNKDGIFIYKGIYKNDDYKGCYFTSNDGNSWLKFNDISQVQKYYKKGENIYAYDDTFIYKYDSINRRWIKSYDTLKISKLGGNAFIPLAKKYILGMWVNKETLNKPLPNILIYNLETTDTVRITDTTSDIWKHTITSFVEKDGLLFAGTTGGVYVSTDEGLHWKKKNNGLHYKDSLKSFDFEAHKFFIKDDKIYALLSGPTKNGILQIQTSTFLAYTTNNGEYWIIPNSLIQYFKPRFINKINNQLLVATHEGLFFVDDSLTEYKNVIDTLISGNSYDITISGDTIYSVLGYSFNGLNKGIWKSTNGGLNWEKAKDTLITDLSKIIVKDSIIIVCNEIMGANPYLSRDYGRTFHQFKLKDDIPQASISTIAYFEGKFYIGSRNGLFVSEDNGKKWNELVSNFWIRSMEFYNNYIFAGINGNRVLISSNNGQSWSKVQVCSDNSENSSIISLKIIDKTLFAGTYHLPQGAKDQYLGKGLYFSNDFGETWQEANNGLPPNLGISSIVNYDKNIFLSMNDYAGVYYSSDFGKTWKCNNKGLTNSTIYKLSIYRNYLFAATYGGIYRVSLSDLGIVSVDDSHINKKQDYLWASIAYPNPAKDYVQAKVWWDTHNDIEKAEIAVYDIYGNLIAGRERIEIIPENDYSGIIRWECGDVPSGVYILTIQHGTRKQAVRLVKE